MQEIAGDDKIRIKRDAIFGQNAGIGMISRFRIEVAFRPADECNTTAAMIHNKVNDGFPHSFHIVNPHAYCAWHLLSNADHWHGAIVAEKDFELFIRNIIADNAVDNQAVQAGLGGEIISCITLIIELIVG